MEKKRQARFQRTKPYAYKKLGSRTKVRYKRPTGRHNKSRQKWRSRPPMVEVGYKNRTTTRNLISGKKPAWVYNLEDLKNVGKDNIIVLGKIGKKKKIELALEIQKKGFEIFNLNINKFLKKNKKANGGKNEESK